MWKWWPSLQTPLRVHTGCVPAVTEHCSRTRRGLCKLNILAAIQYPAHTGHWDSHYITHHSPPPLTIWDWCVDVEEVRAPLHCAAGAMRQWDHLIHILARCRVTPSHHWCITYYSAIFTIHTSIVSTVKKGTESFVLFPTSNISLSNTSNVTTPRLENIISIFSLTAQIRWPHSYNWIGFILSSYWHLVTPQVLFLSVELLLQCRAPTVPDPCGNSGVRVIRNLLQLHHVHGGEQRGHHHHDPQLPPPPGRHPRDAQLGEF